MFVVKKAVQAQFPRFTRRMVPVTPSQSWDNPITQIEMDNVRSIIASLSGKNPDIIRAFIAHHSSEYNNKGASLSAHAKFDREQGKGKTLFFSYLSVVDKCRILELSGAPGAKEVIENKCGKMSRTAFFADISPDRKVAALRDWQKEREASKDKNDNATPHRRELIRYILSQGVPMIGFGFVDNFFMLVFGGAIDAYFCVYVSTMAAAGLGNLCSNILGLGFADHIEHLSTKLGLPAPVLSKAQREMPLVRLSGLLGIVLGVSIGCIMGLVPCYFMPQRDHSKSEEEEEKQGEAIQLASDS